MIDRIIPGVSIETIAGERDAQLGVSGVVAMPLPLDWGDTVTIIERGDDTQISLGYRLTDPKIKMVGEVMNYANRLILYRSNGGAQATGTIATNITATAAYPGTRGNDISVVVSSAGEQWEIKTMLGTVEMDSQVVASVDDFAPNGLVTITGSGSISIATVKLAGGTSDSESAIDEFIAELPKHQYNIISYTGTEQTELTALLGFVKEQRKNGTMIQLVQSLTATNDPAIYHSTIGLKCQGYDLTAAEACATMAGVLAKQGVEGSATHYNMLVDILDTATRPTVEQQKTRTRNGEILFVMKNARPIVLYDINSLTTFTDAEPKDFSKGLVMRTLDKYQTDLKMLLDQKIIGKIRNHLNGRNQIKGMVVKMTSENYLAPEYIEGFTADDVTVDIGTDRDAIKVTVGILVVDTVDKIYVTVIAL